MTSNKRTAIIKTLLSNNITAAEFYNNDAYDLNTLLPTAQKNLKKYSKKEKLTIEDLQEFHAQGE